MVERCALSGSDLKIKFRTILLTSIITIVLYCVVLYYIKRDWLPCKVVFRVGNQNTKCDKQQQSMFLCLQKNQNTPRPSEHPPVMGEKMSNRLGAIKGCKYKTSSWPLNRFSDADNIGSTVYCRGEPTVILYIYINRHAGTPEKH